MLSVNSLEAVLPLAELMDRNNLMVTPIEGTPLDELVKATRTTEKFAQPLDGKQGEYVVMTHDIAYMANKVNAATGVCDHHIAQDALVEMASKAVKNYLVVLRTAIKPAIMELHDAVAKLMSDMPTSKLLGWSVKSFDLPAPMKSSAIEGLISKWEGVPYASPALRMKCPDVTMDQLRTLMKTGAAGFDGDIDKWIAVKGDSWFLQLWEDLFQTKNDRFSKFNQAVECREEGLDRSLAVFLIARKLAEDPIEGINMSLPALKALASEFRDQAASRIQRGLEEWAKVLQRKQLVRSTDDNCIVVNENVYRPWIMDKGGDIDILLGNLATKSGFTTEEQLTQNAERLKAAWTRVLTRTSAADRTERFTLLKQILSSEFRKSVSDLKGDVDGPDASAGERAEVLKRFSQLVTMLRPSDCTDLYVLCTKLVCRARFYKVPEAEEFFLQMMQIEKDEPGISPRDASTIATLDYIACYVADQFKVLRVRN